MLGDMKVLSFCHFIQGPIGSQYLADMGADVIKVEPLTGAWERVHGSGAITVGGRSVSLLAGNRNKRSLSINLKHPKARDILYPVIARCDVLMENYRLGALDRLGFGYEDVKRVKPDIIYASATGWGATGPMRNAPGVDLLVQARSGLIASGGRQGGFLSMPGAPVVDHHGGALFAMGVLAAYARKLTTGEGTRVETSLLAAGLDVQAEPLALYASGDTPRKTAERDGHLGAWYVDAPYGVYELVDCHVVLGGAANIAGLTELIGSPALMALGPDGHKVQRDAYARLLAEELVSWTLEELAAKLAGSEFWLERVASYEDVLADPQVEDQRRFLRFPVRDDAATVVAHPVAYDGAVPGLRRAPPELGQDTRDILAEVGFGSDDIARFIDGGAVKAA